MDKRVNNSCLMTLSKNGIYFKNSQFSLIITKSSVNSKRKCPNIFININVENNDYF